MSETRVVNIRSLPPGAVWPSDHVYIGRAATFRGRYLEASVWANPFVVGRDGDRAEVIELYRMWFTSENPKAIAVNHRLEELRGKTLICWCKPEACHGDLLAEMADTCTTVCGEYIELGSCACIRRMAR